MSRRSQDIPIRPRYGYVDETDDAEQSFAAGGSSRDVAPESSTAEHRVMASSYSEIPFLARYANADEQLEATTPTTHMPLDASSKSASLEANDDDDEDSNGSSFEAPKTPKRPDSLQCGDSSVPYELEGSVRHEGQMLHFVASNLEHTLKTASPVTKKDLNQLAGGNFSSRNSTPSTSTTGVLTRQFMQAPLPQIDANVLNDIEIEAQYLAASVDNLTENLGNLLHSISSITADNVEVHKNAVNKLTDSMDANIKCMYTIMAKTEEITKSMKPTEALSQRIREIKRLVDVLESM